MLVSVSVFAEEAEFVVVVLVELDTGRNESIDMNLNEMCNNLAFYIFNLIWQSNNCDTYQYNTMLYSNP